MPIYQLVFRTAVGGEPIVHRIAADSHSAFNAWLERNALRAYLRCDPEDVSYQYNPAVGFYGPFVDEQRPEGSVHDLVALYWRTEGTDLRFEQIKRHHENRILHFLGNIGRGFARHGCTLGQIDHGLAEGSMWFFEVHRTEASLEGDADWSDLTVEFHILDQRAFGIPDEPGVTFAVYLQDGRGRVVHRIGPDPQNPESWVNMFDVSAVERRFVEVADLCDESLAESVEELGLGEARQDVSDVRAPRTDQAAPCASNEHPVVGEPNVGIGSRSQRIPRQISLVERPPIVSDDEQTAANEPTPVGDELVLGSPTTSGSPNVTVRLDGNRYVCLRDDSSLQEVIVCRTDVPRLVA